MKKSPKGLSSFCFEEEEEMLKIFSGIKDFAVKRMPELCVGFGLAAFGGAIVSAICGTIKAKETVDEVKEDLHVDTLSKKEVVRLTWRNYIWTGVSVAVGTTLIILGDREHNKRNAALSVAYAGLETTLNAYKDKITEVVGEKKSQEIKEAVAQDILDNHPIIVDEVIPTGKGDTIIYDVLSGRYFRSSLNEVDRVINDLNQLFADLKEEFIPLNYLYEQLNIPRIALGDRLGWNYNDGHIRRYKGDDSCFGTTTSGEPCKVMSFYVEPRFAYHE